MPDDAVDREPAGLHRIRRRPIPIRGWRRYPMATTTSRLPRPVMEEWDWQYQGNCRDHSAHLFFHPENERGPARRLRAAAAVAVCRECPVIKECREHALAVQEPFGTWGGLTEEDREVIRRKRRPAPLWAAG
jgi:WhiB family redox-sensing transcriptional regulator